MIKKQIKQLAMASFTKDNLDEIKTNKIGKLLTRSNLKLYIKYLKALEKNKTVFVYTSDNSQRTELSNKIKEMYPNKNIVYKVDNSLIAGIKIIENDNIYEFNIKNTLDNLVSYINN
jgi:F0F1-type ATP synthase delta subunit